MDHKEYMSTLGLDSELEILYHHQILLPVIKTDENEVRTVTHMFDNICLVDLNRKLICVDTSKILEDVETPQEIFTPFIYTTNTISVAVGNNYNCAMHLTGHVHCWCTLDLEQ